MVGVYRSHCLWLINGQLHKDITAGVASVELETTAEREAACDTTALLADQLHHNIPPQALGDDRAKGYIDAQQRGGHDDCP